MWDAPAEQEVHQNNMNASGAIGGGSLSMTCCDWAERRLPQDDIPHCKPKGE